MRSHVVMLAVMAAVAAGCGSQDNTAPAGVNAPKPEAFATVKVGEIADRIQDDDVVLVDVREPLEWAAGHAPKAMHVPLDDVAGSLDEIRSAANGRPVAFICRSGSRSAEAARTAVKGGLTDVTSIDGGMRSWADAGLPLEP